MQILHQSKPTFSKVSSKSSQNYFYTALVDLFKSAYPNIDENKISELRYISYSYFKSILKLDSCLDNIEVDKKDIIACIHDLESISVRLSQLFPYHHNFWIDFKKYKNDYYKAFEIEKKISMEDSSFSKCKYENLSELKSSLCFAIVSALGFLSNSNENNKKVYECLRLIHIAFQYNDDVADFYDDLNSKQITYPHVLTYRSLLDNKIEVKKINKNRFFQQYFYSSGLAAEMLRNAQDKLNKSLELCLELNLLELKQFLKEEIFSIQSQINEINLLIMKTRSKFRNSEELLRKNFKNFGTTLNESIDYGLEKIENDISKDNQLNDFITSAGEGKNWISAYSCFMLSGYKESRRIVKKLFNSKLFIETVNGEKSEFGFNDSIINDGDSLAFLLGALTKNDFKLDSEQINELVAYQSNKGGWCTYNNENKIRKRLNLDSDISIAGWTQSKCCISASNAYIFCNTSELNEYNDKTYKFLLGNIENDKLPSYWWTSHIYATSFAIMAFQKKSEYITHAYRLSDNLIKEQNIDGSWSDSFLGEKSNFYTALAMNALVECDFQKYRTSIMKSVDYILRNQMKDGSWKSIRILAIPATSVINHSEVTKWRKSSFGVNVLVDDHNRIFTTVTVLKSLLSLKSKII